MYLYDFLLNTVDIRQVFTREQLWEVGKNIGTPPSFSDFSLSENHKQFYSKFTLNQNPLQWIFVYLLAKICRLDYISGGEDAECIADYQVGWVFAVLVYMGCTL